MHQILAHSAALFEANESTGLGEYSKEPLEHYNKNIRKYRDSLARKTTQSANLSDVLTRLWIKSDPIIRCHRRFVEKNTMFVHVQKSRLYKAVAFHLRILTD